MKKRNWFVITVLVLATSLALTAPVGATSYPAGTGAAEINTLGYTNINPWGYDDAVYQLSFTFDHTASSLVLIFSGYQLTDESWGLDNVVVSANGGVVYSNDFQGTVGPEWSSTTTDTAPNGAKFLGQFLNDPVTLSLSLPGDQKNVTVSFDLYIIGSWDGNCSAYGPDEWELVADGPTLLHATFSNCSCADQSYCPPPPPPPGGQGCTPGYWKQKQHFDFWVNYSTDDDYETVFGVDASFNKDLLGTLKQGGGGEKALSRHAVAALLNAANPDVNYFYSEAEVIGLVLDAYATGYFESTKNLLEAQNEQGCPLD